MSDDADDSVASAPAEAKPKPKQGRPAGVALVELHERVARLERASGTGSEPERQEPELEPESEIPEESQDSGWWW